MNKTGIDIIDRLYFLTGAAGIPDLINGSIHKGNYSPNSESVEDEFIVINTLQLRNYDVVREIPANINLYVSDKDGQTDLTRFRFLTHEIEERLKPYESLKGTLTQKLRDKAGAYTDAQIELTAEYFKFKITMSHGPFKDDRENDVFKRHSKFNFRVNCWIEK